MVRITSLPLRHGLLVMPVLFLEVENKMEETGLPMRYGMEDRNKGEKMESLHLYLWDLRCLWDIQEETFRNSVSS